MCADALFLMCPPKLTYLLNPSLLEKYKYMGEVLFI
jgi:hypothetical protein